MRTKRIRALFGALIVWAVLAAGCGGGPAASAPAASGEPVPAASSAADTAPAATAAPEDPAAEIAGDYYVDLTELGMKLTFYLRIGGDGAFLFSNTKAFEVNKSSGTVQKTDDGYLMVYDSVNGEEKSISEGLTSKFLRRDDGSLDFTVCDRIYYGSASALTTSAENPDAKLIARILPADYEVRVEESVFTVGTYAAVPPAEGGDGRRIHIGFYGDGTYLIFIAADEDGRAVYASEVGRYGVSTTQLALTPQDGARVSGEVISADELSVSVPGTGNGERTVLTFRKAKEVPVLAEFAGTGKKTGTDESFSARLTLYADGGFVVKAGAFEERGLLAPDGRNGTFRIYPDHPETKTRGVNQVATVPAGTLQYSNEGKLTLVDFRARTSESYSRDKCTFVQEEEK